MFPLLYGKSKNDKIKSWCISVVKQEDKALIIIRHGYLDGKIIEICKEINKGKNLGKKNETSFYEQAQSEALMKWTKKKEEGYTEDKNNIKQLLLPMLAHTFDPEKNKNVNKVIFPCYIQPKKDGIRCVFNPAENVMHTRTGKIINNVNNILNQLKSSKTTLILDGELINEDIPFEKFAGLMNKKKLLKEDLVLLNNVKFYIFDCVMVNVDFENRLHTIQSYFSNNTFQNIHLLETFKINQLNEIYKYHDKFITENNEGTIIRNTSGLYEINFRSYNLLKYKNFIDDEFEIVNFQQGTGIEDGCVIWVCKTKQGLIFDVRPKGTFEERKLLYKNANKYIGKMLTVRYQELFDNSDKPRFGIGLAIRDYE